MNITSPTILIANCVTGVNGDGGVVKNCETRKDKARSSDTARLGKFSSISVYIK